MEPATRKHAGLRWLLLPLLLIGGVAIIAGALWLRSGKPAPQAVKGPAPPIAAEPPAPPADWKPAVSLASRSETADLSSGLEKTLQNIPGKVSALSAELKKTPAAASAPAALLVLPGDVRGVESISRIPRHERWEIQFPPGNTIDSYSRQLDFFKIELGVIGDGDKATYLTNLSAPMPTVRSEAAGQDQRLYLIWQRGALREAAEELASRGKIDPRGKVLAHFCPAEIESQLSQLEEKHAAEKGHRHIRRTTFGIEPSDAGGYRFVVVDQKADTQ